MAAPAGKNRMKRKKNIPTLKKLLTIAALGLTATAAYTQSYDEILRLRGMNETVQGIRSMADLSLIHI